jgi:hypothetical protein
MRFLYPNFKFLIFIFSCLKKLFLFSFKFFQKAFNKPSNNKIKSKKVKFDLELDERRYKRLPSFLMSHYGLMSSDAFKDYFKDVFNDVIVDTESNSLNKLLSTGHLILGVNDIKKLEEYLTSNNLNYSTIQ